MRFMLLLKTGPLVRCLDRTLANLATSDGFVSTCVTCFATIKSLLVRLITQFRAYKLQFESVIGTFTQSSNRTRPSKPIGIVRQAEMAAVKRRAEFKELCCE